MTSHVPSWPKRCACGLTWTIDTWAQLALCGEWHVEHMHVELRSCTCGSTISMPIAALRA